MTEHTNTFVCGSNYTPGTVTRPGWAQIDAGFMREQFTQMRETGIRHIMIQPSWFRIQPTASRISTAMMQRIEQCLDMAAQAHIDVTVSLLAVETHGALALPEWHNHADVVGWLQGHTTQPVAMTNVPAIIDGQWHTLHAANPFRTENLVRAQRELVRTVMGYFASHPACAFWMLGAGWSRLQSQVSTQHALQWWQTLCETARHVAPHARLMSFVDAPTLTNTHALSLQTLVNNCHTLVVNTAMPELRDRQQRRLTAPARFCHELVSALSHKPVIVALSPILRTTTQAHWHQIPWHQQQLAVPCISDEDAGQYVAHLLDALYNAGAAGVIWPEAFEQPAGGDDIPLEWRTMQHALLNARGQQHGAGQAWARWHQHTRVVQAASSTIDSERFWHQPQRELARLWHAYE